MFYDSLHFYPVVSELAGYLIYFFISYSLLLTITHTLMVNLNICCVICDLNK